MSDSIKKENGDDIIKLVSGFKNDFQEIVTETVNKSPKNKIIIFVDDIDRLNPEVAVELLEIIKLFMDVKDCNFVLAVDYDVVVSGVRKKYGNNMTDAKCRSFFDKIIQVPFTMPVAKYDIRGMFEETFEDYVKNGYLEPVFKLFIKAIGSNPRTFKRFANSFILLEKIYKEQTKDSTIEPVKVYCHNSLLLISLSIQLGSPEVYDEMLSYDDYSSLEQYFDNIKNNIKYDIEEKSSTPQEKNQKVFQNSLLITLIKALEDISKNAGKKINVYEEFYGILKLASSVSTSSVKSQEGEKITKISIGDDSYNVGNATEALEKTYNILLENNKDKLTDSFIEQLGNILTYDAAASKSLFRAKKRLEVQCNGKEIFLGTSSGTPVKMTQANKLCHYLELPARHLIWYSGENAVFEND